ncbi:MULTISPECIES: beta-ketoacyl-[acyl-carrier-protein] synthase family protein [Saccharopolyspora]|uniref:Beta-ketoacyl-[acyl-carrier-protein] synthase family protein n=1 Tax=Saccharopolyspora elongata TaxID=2530387 RepID=A0A4R4YGY6_9PSEU|nr:beta-ketoacyl-[acyl-carrier-protein] synthase family protein [Saccharopolyspora elongata]TDD44118.1 beta-ketoacyl-[acyl-carrier-protein] synthase family protein [Saccharopolyspora elongata]
MRDAATHRVVITGIGAVSSIGIGVPDFLAGLRAGDSAVKPISAFDTSGYEHSLGCEIDDFEPQRWIRNIAPDGLGRASQFSVAAARMAVDDAGLSEEALRERRCLSVIGTTDGEARDLDQLVETELRSGPGDMDPAVAARVPAGRLSTAVADEFGLRDVEAVTLPTACAAGNYAIGYGFDAIRAGDVDFALCGGADALCRKTFTGFYRIGTIAPERCQPFDKDRKGILTGEGAGVLVLESLESALARGARIHAEVLGFGLNCDAFHQVAPNEDSVARCMRLALDDAGVKPGEVDFISAHGTGTKANDVTEASAIRRVFGADTAPRTISIKSMLGHTMGAASALASIACVLAITENFIPPTINHVETDPECGVDCVPNEAVEAQPRIVQNNGLAFGGNNAVVIYGKYEEERV